MCQRLQTTQGKQIYKLRQQTIEPVLGIIKLVLGVCSLLLRGLTNVSTEWTLVCLVYNLRHPQTLTRGT